MKKLRWGILSTSKFALSKIVPAMKHCQYAEINAIASRDPKKAAEAAARNGIPQSYGSYQELLDDPGIDVVYNPMPNHLHVPWSIKAMQAGKHVLCEKPISLTSAEAQQLLDESKRHPRLKVMEAFMYRHHPQWRRARDLVRDGRIGHLCTIQSIFSYFNQDASNIRNRADIGGGGGLMDIGCYSISLSRFIFDAEPVRVFGVVEMDPVFKVDRLASGILDFGNGTSTFTCGTQIAPYQRVNIFGTEGRIEIEIPFNPPPDQPTRIWRQHKGGLEEIVIPVCDQYTIQGDLFSEAILDNGPVPTPLEDAVANMKVIEAVFDSARTGTWA
ncbi:MAG: Gfo/Idh/MocA family oxidoreductase [Acidobacteriota bacterium]|nr:MAG: Gfo/Idh/MocA family oxidoreductase [Acidobacteriota bacterium]